jgi:hypothetical protein
MIFSSTNGLCLSLAFVVGISGNASPVLAQDWNSVPVRLQSEYQATRYSSGSWVSAYSGGFPLRLQGVVINANEDWLDPTAAYDADYHPYNLGGQAEIIVQAAATGDFGGTFCWMGQNYGNMPWIQDSSDSYTDAQWYAELNRLQLWHPTVAGLPEALPREQLVRPGDYVEIRARAGLWYGGKMNVNEQHFNTANKDFEVVVLERGRGWSEPTNLTLADLKNTDDSFIFNTADPQNSGGEHYQGSQVTLKNVHLVNPGDWGENKDVLAADNTGRTFNVHLSLGSGFANYAAPQGTFSVTGIIDQASTTGNNGYRLLAMNSGDLFHSWSYITGTNLWSSSTNWDGNTPVEGEGIHFSGSTGGTAVNDFTSGRAVGGIVFEANAGEFTLSGNTITLTGDLVSFSSQTQTLAVPLTLSNEEHTIYSAVGNIIIQNPLENNGYLRKIGSGSVTLSGGIYGTGTLDVEKGILSATSIVQSTLIIGGMASASNATVVPEPAAWLLILSGVSIFLALNPRLVQTQRQP